MVWAINAYRTVLEAYCAEYKAASQADRENILGVVIQKLREVEAQEGGMKKPLPEQLKTVPPCQSF